MSDIHLEGQREQDWEEWLDEKEYGYLGGEMYECAGNHVWHVDDLIKLFEEFQNGKQ